jgi:hypothetical protein
MLNKGGHRGGAFLSYFKDLFSAGENLDVAACVEVLDSKVTPAMNQQLLSKFTIEEISGTLNQMSSLKAPGPDGFSVCFYQHNWSTIYPEVCAATLYFLNSCVMDPSINPTHIALISEVLRISALFLCAM